MMTLIRSRESVGKEAFEQEGENKEIAIEHKLTVIDRIRTKILTFFEALASVIEKSKSKSYRFISVMRQTL